MCGFQYENQVTGKMHLNVNKYGANCLTATCLWTEVKKTRPLAKSVCHVMLISMLSLRN